MVTTQQFADLVMAIIGLLIGLGIGWASSWRAPSTALDDVDMEEGEPWDEEVEDEEDDEDDEDED